MKFLPPLSPLEEKAQRDFQGVLLRYLESKSNTLTEDSVLRVLGKNGFSPKLELHESCRITLAEFFEILAIVNEAEFTQQVLEHCVVTRAEPVVKPKRKSKPRPTPPPTPPTKSFASFLMDTDFL